MIYAIEAVGSGFIKFGRAASVGRRLKEMETGCPYELSILAVADWPNGVESTVHRVLAKRIERREWFADCEESRQVILWMLDRQNGLLALQHEHSKLYGNDWRIIPKRSSARSQEIVAARAELQRWRDQRVKEGPSKPRLLSRARDTKIEIRRSERAAWWRENSHVIAAGQQCQIPISNQHHVSADSSIIIEE